MIQWVDWAHHCRSVGNDNLRTISEQTAVSQAESVFEELLFGVSRDRIALQISPSLSGCPSFTVAIPPSL